MVIRGLRCGTSTDGGGLYVGLSAWFGGHHPTGTFVGVEMVMVGSHRLWFNAVQLGQSVKILSCPKRAGTQAESHLIKNKILTIKQTGGLKLL